MAKATSRGAGSDALFQAVSGDISPIIVDSSVRRLPRFTCVVRFLGLNGMTKCDLSSSTQPPRGSDGSKRFKVRIRDHGCKAGRSAA